MAAGFNLTAQLQLQAPTNTSQVANNIRKQLSNISVNVQVKGDAGSLSKINSQMQNVNKSAEASSRSISNLNRNLSEAARRFSVITVATGTMLALARAIKNSVGEAIAFERELVRISQVTGKTIKNLSELTSEITRLSTGLGTSSSELLNVSRVLAQAGFSAQKTRAALDILAKTDLGATFDSLTDTTEGAIAVLRQFRREAAAAGGEIKFLEQTLDAINSVSKQFAVESGDLITVIRRVGGVFESAGGSVNELIALFTSVRATTRESAETIATGLRTIFTRLQRTDTVNQLQALGIALNDAQGQFVGAYEAVRRLSVGLSSLDPRDYRFSEIIESLGGFRQVGKVIPLIRQFATAQNALNVAQSASGSVARDAVTAQQSLAVQAQKVREEFAALMRSLADSQTFRSVATGALEMARGFIRIVEALEPLLPLLTSLVALKIGKALAPGLGALTGITGKAQGGRIHKFARGGFVPGSGNRDTVPAMLQPGEFVIKKSSASKLGSGTLEAMNNNRYRPGGVVGGATLAKQIAEQRKDPKFGGKTSKKDIGFLNELEGDINALPEGDKYGGAFLSPVGQGSNLSGSVKGASIKGALAKNATFKLLKASKKGSALQKEATDLEKAANKKSDFTLLARSLTPALSESVEAKILDGVEIAVRGGAAQFQKDVGVRGGTQDMSKILRTANVDNVIGNLFEASILRSGAPFAESDRDSANAPFDFPGGLGGRSKSFQNAAELASIDTDAKTRYTSGNISSFLTKVRDTKTNELTSQLDKIISELDPNDIETGFATRGSKATEGLQARKKLKDRVAKKAAGGKIDSVPALLTPGEYVINKSSAQSIGYGNLNKMNQTGVQRFAKGGPVQRFASGGTVASGDFGLTSAKDLALVNAAAKRNADAFNNLSQQVATLNPDEARAAMIHFARNFDAAGDEATQLDAAMEAAHKQIGQSGSGSTRTPSTTGPAPPPPPGQVGPLAGGQAPSGNMMAQAAQDMDSFGVAASESSRALVEFKVGVMKGKSYNDALNAAMVAAQKRQEEAVKANADLTSQRKSLAAQLKTGAKGAGKILGAPVSLAKGAAGMAKKAVGSAGVQDASKSLGDMAGAAQQVSFFAGTMAVAGVQASNLSEAQKKAATEAIGFGTSVLGIGATVTQMLTGLVSSVGASTASEIAETGANVAVTASEEAETAANMKAAGGGGKLGGALGIMGIAITAVISALKYYSAEQKAIADDARKSWNESLDSIKEGGSVTASTVKQNIAKEVDARAKSTKMFESDAIATAAGYTAMGAAIGSVIPGLGTLVGAGIGAAIGAFMGFNAAMNDVDAEMQAEAAARKAQVEAIYDSVDSIISMSEATYKLNEAISTIESAKGLSDERKLELRMEAGTEGLGAGAVGGATQAQDSLRDLAGRLGVTTDELQGADDAKIEKLAADQGLDASEAATAVSQFAVATKQATAANELAAANLKAAAGTYGLAADQVSKAANFTELNKRMAEADKALGAQIAAINQSSAVEMQAAKNAYQASGNDQKAREAAEKNMADIEKRRATSVKLATEGNNELYKSTKARIQAEADAAAAAEAMRQEFVKLQEFSKGLANLQADQANRGKAQANEEAIQSGEGMDFSAAEVDVSDVTLIRDMQAFADDMNEAISYLPPKLRGEAQKQIGIVAETNRLFTTGKNNALKAFAVAPGEEGVNVNKILEAAGLDPKKMDKDVLKEVTAKLKDAAADGLSAAEFDEVFAPLREQGEMAAANLEQIQAIRQEEISLYSNFLKQQQSLREEALSAEQAAIAKRGEMDEMMAKARGRELSIQAKEAQRTKQAQAALAGTGVRAGDAKGAVLAKKRMEAERRAIAIKLKDEELMRKQPGLRKRLMDADAKLVATIKQVDGELERLGDQSERASDLMAEIDKEKEKRETLTNLISEFVVGGGDERKGINEALMGVVSAVQTGTIQNQSPDQRAATFSMLDRLENIVMPGTGGMTGGEVKQELVFRDAVNMGLDPAIAKELATQTSKEQQMINELEALNKTMVAVKDAVVKGGGGGIPGFPWTGGYISSRGTVQYRAGGGSIFQPKGTDTVPAMLTPGEYVIKRSAVKNIGVDTLAAINAGRYANGGLVQYRQQGGGINVGNAEFAGGDIKIMDSEMLKTAFAQTVSVMQPADFYKIMRENGYDKDETNKLSQLQRRGGLDVRKLSFPDSTAKHYGALAEYFTTGKGANVLQMAGNGVIMIKPPTVGFSPATDKANDVKDWQNGLQKYMNGIKKVAEDVKGMMGGNAFDDMNRGFGVTQDVLKQGFGIDTAAGYRIYPNLLAYGLQIEKLWKGKGVKDKDMMEALTAGMNLAGGEGKFRAGKDLKEDVKNIRGGKGGAADFKPATEDKASKNAAKFNQLIADLVAAGILKMAKGGSVPGSEDTVPAMLTPGEFVMSKQAVAKHGVGYMKNLNRGRIPGFNRGGLVGRGAVQYKQNGGTIGNGGGVLSLDPTRVQGVLDTFNTNFSATLDKLAGPMSGLNDSFASLAASFSNLTMTHEFSGEIGMSVNISNKDAIVAAVTEGLTPHVTTLITEQINAAIASLKDGV
jgi:hypothetical protein